jgi:hypothetical protein
MLRRCAVFQWRCGCIVRPGSPSPSGWRQRASAPRETNVRQASKPHDNVRGGAIARRRHGRRVLRRQLDRVTRGGGGLKAIVGTAAAGRPRLGDSASRRATPTIRGRLLLSAPSARETATLFWRGQVRAGGAAQTSLMRAGASHHQELVPDELADQPHQQQRSCRGSAVREGPQLPAGRQPLCSQAAAKPGRKSGVAWGAGGGRRRPRRRDRSACGCRRVSVRAASQTRCPRRWRGAPSECPWPVR